MSLPLVVALLLAQAPSNLSALEAATKAQPDAAHYRALSDAYVAAGQFTKASGAFAKASALYAKLGDSNAAKVLEIQAQRYETKIGLYVDQPTSYYNAYKNWTHARYEPMYGCYTGAFIDREDGIDDTFYDDNQTYGNPSQFDEKIGKKQAIYFTYLKYGRNFPEGWAERLYENRSAAQIVWEPGNLNEVQNNAYLQRFADACRKSRIPIFLRYAGEMNGDWVPYGQDPQLYREKFRLVSTVIHNYAPNVAMVWCPNEIPEDKIAQYFPGDDVVDWVGVNFYAVTYNDADRARGAEWMNPADKLKFIYSHYAAKHPIMVGEWAATHLSVVDHLPRPDYAQIKIAQLYAALPRIYPRVKAVSWLSMNTITHAMPGRQLNDYSLLDAPRVANAYSRAVASPYFLDAVPKSIAQVAPVEIDPLINGMKVKGKIHLSAYVKSYDQQPSVEWVVNSRPAYQTDVPGAYGFDLDTSGLSGKVTIELIVRDKRGQVAGGQESTIVVGK